MKWVTRSELGSLARGAEGLLLLSSDASSVIPLSSSDRTAAASDYAAALAAAGASATDRVVVALSSDGELAGVSWAHAAAGVCAAGASVGPRGRLRLHHALSSVRATTLIITPTGAMDFLSRLHLEFLLDPLDLGLRHIVLTGEIASKQTMSHLATEFEASVTEVYASPFSATPLAWRSSQADPLTPLDPARLGLASLDKDEPFAAPYPTGLAELVIHNASIDAHVRTGQVVQLAGDAIPAPAHTVGDHVLVRGHWLSLPRLERALAKIDGVSAWELALSRDGTLDQAVLTVTFNRESLIKNPMWRTRIEQALVALTPITVTVGVAAEISEETRPGVVTDLRGHHLGRDRTAIAH